MKRKDLTGHKFTGKDGTKYVILAGHEGAEVAYRKKDDKNASLWFCCNVQRYHGRLMCSYTVCYCVSQKEFFDVIDDSTDEDKTAIETIVAGLKHTYYKIPNVFLNLVAKMYLNERR